MDVELPWIICVRINFIAEFFSYRQKKIYFSGGARHTKNPYKKNKLQSIPDFTKKAVLWTLPLFLPVNYLCQTFFHQKSKIQFIGESENLLLSSSLFNLYSFDLSLWERVLKSFHFNLFSMDSIKKIKKKAIKE